MSLQLVKQDDRGRVYEAGQFRIYYRNSGTVTGANAENAAEHIYLISGTMEITVGSSISTQAAPAVFEIPARTYHKIVAVTDIAFILMSS